MIVTQDLIEMLTGDLQDALGDLLDNGPNKGDDERVSNLMRDLRAAHQSLMREAANEGG